MPPSKCIQNSFIWKFRGRFGFSRRQRTFSVHTNTMRDLMQILDSKFLHKELLTFYSTLQGGFLSFLINTHDVDITANRSKDLWQQGESHGLQIRWKYLFLSIHQNFSSLWSQNPSTHVSTNTKANQTTALIVKFHQTMRF